MDENSWNEITLTLEDMLEATRGICVNAEDSNVQVINCFCSWVSKTKQLISTNKTIVSASYSLLLRFVIINQDH